MVLYYLFIIYVKQYIDSKSQNKIINHDIYSKIKIILLHD